MKLLSYNIFKNPKGDSKNFNCTYLDEGEIYQFGAENITSDLPNAQKLMDAAALEEFVKTYHSARFTSERVRDFFDTFLGDIYGVESHQLTFKGVTIDSLPTSFIVHSLENDGDVFQEGLTNFLEDLYENTDLYVREQLLRWLNFVWTNGAYLTVLPDGRILGYKGCAEIDGIPYSQFSGTATVDGEKINGRIPNATDSIITMDRKEVQANPAMGCSYGLHVGSYQYASNFSSGVLIACAFKASDVVSVPTECDSQKVRVCEYQVLGVIDGPCRAGFINYEEAAEYNNKIYSTPRETEHQEDDLYSEDEEDVELSYHPQCIYNGWCASPFDPLSGNCQDCDFNVLVVE